MSGLMSILTIGYVQIMIFFSMIVSICCYYFYKWCSDIPYEEYEHLEPYKCWKLVDDGIFALLDNIEEDDYWDDWNEVDNDGLETRS